MIRVSASSGEGLEDWHAWLRQERALNLTTQQQVTWQPEALVAGVER